MELIAEKEKMPFEDAYLEFSQSLVYEDMQNTETVLWYESPEYIMDEYYKKKQEILTGMSLNYLNKFHFHGGGWCGRM